MRWQTNSYKEKEEKEAIIEERRLRDKLRKGRRLLFIVFSIIGIILFFLSQQSAFMSAPLFEVWNYPSQKELESDNKNIPLDIDDKAVFFESLYEYEVSGVVVGKKNYGLVFWNMENPIAPYDVALIWGSNVQENLQDRNTFYYQNNRFVYYRYKDSSNFDARAVANNHLVFANVESRKIIGSLYPGDQIRIKGKLINIRSADDRINWNTSTTRDDTGFGSCEIIYVEEVEVLRRSWANRILRMLAFAFFILAILMLLPIKKNNVDYSEASDL